MRWRRLYLTFSFLTGCILVSAVSAETPVAIVSAAAVSAAYNTRVQVIWCVRFCWCGVVGAVLLVHLRRVEGSCALLEDGLLAIAGADIVFFLSKERYVCCLIERNFGQAARGPLSFEGKKHVGLRQLQTELCVEQRQRQRQRRRQRQRQQLQRVRSIQATTGGQRKRSLGVRKTMPGIARINALDAIILQTMMTLIV